MKTLQEVVKKRNELARTLENVQSQANSIAKGRRFVELEADERSEYSFLLRVITKLKVQINALTYVINYDSELEDVTVQPIIRHT